MSAKFVRYAVYASILCSVSLMLPGITQCNGQCDDVDAQGNPIRVPCFFCTEIDDNPCTDNSWNVPTTESCVIEDQPLEPDGTPCDDGGVSGMCIAGTCVTSFACEDVAATATQTCLSDVNAAWNDCYATGGGPCAGNDPAIAAALSALDASVTASCSDGEFGSLTVVDLVARLQTSCRSEAASLASRAFGGPQGTAWSNADAVGRTCLESAHQVASDFVDNVLVNTNACLASGSCDAATLETDVQAFVATAEGDVANACTALQTIVALTPEEFIERAHHQSECVVATSQEDTSAISLSCGPTRVDPTPPPRGQYVQVVLDNAEWGSLCGNGSSYAFQLRLAPQGEPLDRVLIGMQGGGVCIFGNDCIPLWQNQPGLFEALSDSPPTSGIMSNSTSNNPFANWTKVYLPYCTQDVFAGGGVPQLFTGFTIERYGSDNVRAAVEYVRDLLWLMLDQEPTGPGYRPDQVTAAFGGWSAGGFGALYNYHWVLDDLQWPQTTAYADASMALDSGDPLFSVAVLGGLVQPLWGALNIFPPYCIAGDCAVGPNLYAATSPRLKAVPNQQLLVLSNQRDGVQISTTFFPSTAQWINEMRSTTCATRDLSGIQYYLTSATNSVHVVSLGSFYNQSVDGQVMSDWIWDAVIGDPNGVTDRMEEGNFVQQIGGVTPFPCSVPP